jgi:hypothetical protein
MLAIWMFEDELSFEGPYKGDNKVLSRKWSAGADFEFDKFCGWLEAADLPNSPSNGP